MNEKNKKGNSNVSKVKSSRNRNKNKNKALQNKARDKQMVKKAKSESNEISKDIVREVSQVTVENNQEVVEEVSNDNVVVEETVIENDIHDDVVENEKPVEEDVLRDEIIVVPERENIISKNEEKLEVIEEKVNKFLFVDSAEVMETNNDLENEEVILEEFNNYPVDNLPKEEKINESLKGEVNTKEVVKPRRYFSFETRVVLLLIGIVVSFFIAGLFVINAIRHGSISGITYSEKAKAEYKVCINENSYYSDKCLDEDMEYLTDIVKNIPVSFKYDVKYSEDLSTELSYYVVSKMNIYTEHHGKVLNTVEDVLVERTLMKVSGDSSDVSLYVDVPFEKYRKHVVDYNSKYNLNSYADLEVVLYIDNGNRIKKVSTISMPVSEKTFGVHKNLVNNEKQNLIVENNEFGQLNATYAVIGVIFALTGLVGIIRLSNLVLKATANTNSYQRKLQRILKDYDKVIVTSRDGYKIDDDKNIVKVTSFFELLDARDTLEKPIVYVRVNNVKSEFYVEDLNTIYKYTMKEADLEDN